MTVRQERIEGTVPAKDRPMMDAATEYLAAKRKKKNAMEKEKEAYEALKTRVQKRLEGTGETSVRVLGFSFELEQTEDVRIVEIDDLEDADDKARDQKSDPVPAAE